MKTMRKGQSLRSRWMRHSAIILLGIMIIAVSAYAVFISSHQHSVLRVGLEAKAGAVCDLFSAFVSRPEEEYRESARRYAASYADKEHLELQFLGADGKVESSNRMGSIGIFPGTEDVSRAFETGERAFFTGRDPQTNERFIALSAPLLDQGGEAVGVMRFVSDLRGVDRQVLYSVLTAAGFGVGVMLLILLCNLYYIRTITEPIQKLTDMAKRIADGSYGIQVKKKYDDEIGVLTDTVNEMSTTLANTEKLQSEFVSSVSHELRTPLTAITGWSETLLYDDAIQGDSRRGIQIISKEASRLAKMVVELLDFTRMQDGRFNLNVESLDLAAELEDIVFTYGSLLEQDGIELCYTPCDDDVPLILGDAERLKQVFLNIIDNAAKYGREGKRVEVGIAFDAEYVTVTVHDYGGGIPENELPFVKKKFYKGSSRERGSGIGLAVCEEIIVRHKGELIIENAAEKGVLVTVKLPVMQE